MLTNKQTALLKKYAPYALIPTPKWAQEMHDELEMMRMEMAVEAFRKRHPNLTQKQWDWMARWLDRNAKKNTKLLNDGFEYKDILGLAYSSLKLKELP